MGDDHDADRMVPAEMEATIVVLRKKLADAEAERDRLRAGIMTAEVHGEMIVRMRESVWLHAEAERDRLRDELEAVRPQYEAHVRMLTVAVEELTAERDRLRRLLADVFTAIYPVPAGPAEVVEHTELPAHVAAMRAERDRLRAVVDAATSDETVERAARVYAEHLSHRAGIRACIRAALESALDGSEPHPERGTVEIGGQVMTQAQYDAVRFPLMAERDRLRAVVDAVRVMWDNLYSTDDEATVGFPIADYNAIEEALDALDGSGDMGTAVEHDP